jgi:hypothetical protein
MNLEELSVADLEKLIRDAGQERAKRGNTYPQNPTEPSFPSTDDPRWEVRRIPNGCALLMRNAHFGWVCYVLPLKEAQGLGRVLDQTARTGETAAVFMLNVSFAPRAPGEEDAS